MVAPDQAKMDAAVATRIESSIRDQPAYILDRFPLLKNRDRKALRRNSARSTLSDWYDRV